MLCINAAYAVMRCLFVCLFMCFTFVDCVETNKHVFKKFFDHRVATPFLFFCTKRYGNIPTDTSLTGALNVGVVGKNRDSQRISGYRIDDCWTCEQQLQRWTVQFTAQTATYQYIFVYINQRGLPRRREENSTEFNCTQ